MIDLRLDSNEEILLQAKRVWRYEEDENQYLENLYLSNKNLICVYEETKGFFSKTETIVDKISLRDIRVVDGIVQVEKVDDDDYEETLQILYRNGKRELYELDEDDDEDIGREYKRWESAISKAVIKYLENCESMAPISDKSANRNELADSQTPKSGEQTIPRGAIQEQEVIYCSNCGTPNSVTAKYCQDCGALMGTVLQTTNEPEQDITVQFKKEQGEIQADNEQHIRNTYSERKQEFVGKIYKCPNCGDMLNSFAANCPSCGYEIRDAKVSNGIQEFTLKLQRIEAKKRPVQKEEKSLMKALFGRDFQKEDDEEMEAEAEFEEQKLAEKAILIRSFSVPNTKEEILEFMVLASSNINPKDGIDDEESKAWITKLEQVYHKAEIVLGQDAEFEKIKNIYQQKMEEIRKEKLKAPIVIALCFAPLILLSGLAWNAVATIFIMIVILGLTVLGVFFYKRERK